MMEDPRTIGMCSQLLFVVKNLERIGDQAVDIGEQVVFLVTGEFHDFDTAALLDH